jgi:hypothetical protein
LHQLFYKPEIIQEIRAKRVRWLEHLFTTDYFYPWRKLTFKNSDGTVLYKEGRTTPIRWKVSAEENPKRSV